LVKICAAINEFEREAIMTVKIGAISVGGRGVRFQRNDIQKCLIPIEGKPILEYTVEAFSQVGIRTIFLLTGFLREQVDAYAAERNRKSDCMIVSVFGGIKGQIPALLKLRRFVHEDFLYAGGDCVFPVDTIRKLIRSAAQHGESVAVMSATRNIDFVESHPRIELIGKSRLVKKIYEPGALGAPKVAGKGIYFFRPAIFDLLSLVEPNSTSPTVEFVKHAQSKGHSVAVSITNDPLFCLHTPDDLAAWQYSRMREFLEKH
jgi:NDP-sugar pyrophosphorylase family protein